MIKIRGTGICKTCKYGSEFSDGCSYILIHKKSRLIENGERYDPSYCTKYEKGSTEQGEIWKKQRKEKFKNGKYI